MTDFAPETCHRALLDAAPLELAYAKHRVGPFEAWRDSLDSTLRRLLGTPPELVPLDVARAEDLMPVADDFRDIRFTFRSEAHADVPCHLLLPKTGDGPFPVVICLQGHTSGMHLSMGRALEEADWPMLKGGRDFGRQAVREGFAALVIEQRCFGERSDRRPKHLHAFPDRCHHASMTAMLLGRTMLGERSWDVSRAIDALESGAFPEVDTSRLACMGNSGGGAITLFASCLDPRITALMPSCYVCTFRDSLASIDHCADNYIPGVLNHFEMADLAGLLAPRPMVVVAGRHDQWFPIAATERSFAAMQEIYADRGAGGKLRLVVGEQGHQFYPEQAWPEFRDVTGW